MFKNIDNWMSSHRWPLYMAMVGFFLTLPALLSGFSADDYILSSAFFDQHLKTANTLFGMFSFSSGDLAINQQQMDIGFLPWWSNPDLLINFWRPLSEFSHAIDFTFWPNLPSLMHLHNSLWYFLLVFLTARVYLTLANNYKAAGIAAFIFSVSVLHANSVGWIANRNALMAGAFGMMCLLAHHKWRNEGHNKFLILSMITLALSLLSAEAGLATTAYLFSYMLFIDRDNKKTRRAMSLLPYAVIVIIWKISYDSLGFGSIGSGAYINPTNDTWLFGAAVIERAPILLLAQMLGQPAGLHIFVPTDIQVLIWFFAVITLIILSFFLLPIILRLPLARFYLLGMLLAILPVCAGNIDERSLIFVSVGGFGLLGLIFESWFSRKENNQEHTKIQSGLIIALIIPHILMSPLMLASSVNSLATFTQTFTNQAITLPIKGKVSDAVVLLVNPPTPQLNMHFSAIRFFHKQEQPRAIYSMAPGSTKLTVSRQGDRLTIDAAEGYIHHYDSLFRSKSTPFTIGETIHLSNMTATVLSVTEDHRPKSVEFLFKQGIENPSIQFLRWKDGEYHHFELPEQNETTELAAISPLGAVISGLGF